MRVFIAIDLPQAIRAELARIQEDLKAKTNSARWVAAESIHITLKFIGEIPESRVEDIDRAVTGMTWKPIPVAVRGLGFFPGERSPRVLWAGLIASHLQALAEKIDLRLERAGFEKEKRKFRAHVTLARAKDNRLDGALVSAIEAFQDHDFGSFTADRCILYESTPKPSGAVYTPLKVYPLSSAVKEGTGAGP